MSKTVEIKEQDLVEVTIKVPKKLMKLLEEQEYFRFDRQYFFEAAIRSLIGCTIGAWDHPELEAFYEKYGRNIDTYYLPRNFIP